MRVHCAAWHTSRTPLFVVFIGCLQQRALHSAQHAGVALQGMVAIFLYGVVALFDGVSIGSGDFAHLPRTNCVAMALCGTALVAVRSRV